MPTIRTRNGRFQAIVRIKEHGVIVFQESRMFDTERLARDWGKRLEAEIARTGVQARRMSRGTVGELIERYRTARNEIRPIGRAMHGDLDMLARHLGAVSIDSLTSQAVVAFARSRRADGAGPATVMHNLAILRSVLGAAEPMFGIPIDGTQVALAIKQLTLTGHVAKSRSRERRATQAEIDALVNEWKRVANYPQTKIPMHLIIPLAVHLPRRISELCGMLWSGYSGSVIELQDTKHPRVVRNERVPVPREARRIIDRLPRMDERILPYNSESVSAAFDRTCARLGIQDLHLHDLRHEGICRLFEAGLQIQEVAVISGHMSWQTLRRYTHITPQHVLERLDARSQGEPQSPASPQESDPGN